MTDIVASIREMLAKGLSIEQALTAAEILESKNTSQTDTRRANDRARQARHRENVSRDVTGGHVTNVTSRDNAQVIENAGRHVTSRDSRARAFRIGEEVKELKKADTSVSAKESEKRAVTSRDVTLGHVTSPRLGTRLPDDWLPSDALRRFAEGLGFIGPSLDEAVAEFRDFWRAVPGPRGRKLDWDATFRNRLRNQARHPTTRKGGLNATKRGSLVDAADKVIRRIDEQFAYLDDVRPEDRDKAGQPAVRLLPGIRRERS